MTTEERWILGRRLNFAGLVLSQVYWVCKWTGLPEDVGVLCLGAAIALISQACWHLGCAIKSAKARS